MQQTKDPEPLLNYHLTHFNWSPQKMMGGSQNRELSLCMYFCKVRILGEN